MNYEKEDFPFLDDLKRRNIFGLKFHVYNLLLRMNNDNWFKTKDELLEFLKGKSSVDFLSQRGFGRRSLLQLREWVEKNLDSQE
jgi:hypothetical protein